jgi:hypothetical protein
MTEEPLKLETDSFDYEVLTEAVKLVANVPGMTCEVGLRAGGGSQFIMQGLKDTNQEKTHIAIDPYGNIEYEAHDNVFGRIGYTNELRDDCMVNIYRIAQQLSINFLFFPLEDTEFFKRYSDGVPIYQYNKTINNQYSLVLFDGPHATTSVVAEFNFFNERAPSGAVFVFDDITHYDHNSVEKNYLFPGWELITKTKYKASYKKL